MDAPYVRWQSVSRKMLRPIRNKSWRQHPTKNQLYGHQSPISKTIQIRSTGNAGRCWRSKDELKSNVLQRTLSHGLASVGWPARTYLEHLCMDTGCNLEDLPGAMDDRDEWLKRAKEICASDTTWWRWYLRGAYDKFPDFFFAWTLLLIVKVK